MISFPRFSNASTIELSTPIYSLARSERARARFRAYAVYRYVKLRLVENSVMGAFDSVSMSPDMQICNNPNSKSLELAQ